MWLTCVVSLLATAVAADVHYPVVLDGSGSTQIGASDLLTFHRGMYAIENQYLRAVWFDEHDPSRKALGIGYRLGKTVLVDNVVDHLTILLQHEVFGHGARYREFGFTGNDYDLSLVPPYGTGNGRAYPGTPPAGRIVTTQERIAMTIGGSEANTVLSNSLRYKWLRRGAIDYRESILYLFASNDLVYYILKTQPSQDGAGSNDVLNYLSLLNDGGCFPTGPVLTLDELKRQAAISLFRPFQYFSLHTYLVSYLWRGDEEFRFPMLDLWSIRYLPSMRLGLTPFNSELYLENLIVGGERVFNIYLRSGIPLSHWLWGFGVSAHNVVYTEKLSLDGCIDVWRQPALQLGGPGLTTERLGFGESVSATVFYYFTRKNAFPGATAEIGYKTLGFLEGEMLNRGFTARIGISFREV
jgi:hypothetical protein